MKKNYFEKFLGNAAIKEQLSAAVDTQRVSHCYMFCGETGLGKKELAKQLAKAMLCDSQENRPCGQCQSCTQIEREDHPDVIYINHEKPTLFSVDEIREFSRLMNIRPYKSEHKIFILRDAQLLNMQAQNAMLKTIEEPPSYGMTILLTNNKDIFLPTVLSRCVEMDLQALSDNDVRLGLIRKGIEEKYITPQLLKRASGNLGLAEKLLNDEVLIEKTDRLQLLMENIPEMKAEDIWREACWLAEEKEDLPMLLAMMRNWFRDVSLCKAGSKDEYSVAVRSQAGQYDYSDFPAIFEAIDTAERQRRVNVSPELVMELMLLKCKGHMI